MDRVDAEQISMYARTVCGRVGKMKSLATLTLQWRETETKTKPIERSLDPHPEGLCLFTRSTGIATYNTAQRVTGLDSNTEQDIERGFRGFGLEILALDGHSGLGEAKWKPQNCCSVHVLGTRNGNCKQVAVRASSQYECGAAAKLIAEQEANSELEMLFPSWLLTG